MSLDRMELLTPPSTRGSHSPFQKGDDEARRPLLTPQPQHVALEMSELPEKRKAKRKDTGSSISNFIHRITQGRSTSDVKDDKRASSVVEEEEVESTLIERPDTLRFPSDDEQWFDSVNNFNMEHLGGGWQTALDSHGKSADVGITQPTQSDIDIPTPAIEMTSIERTLDALLDDFRAGRMAGLSRDQISRMEATTRAHEWISDRHLELATKEEKATPEEREHVKKEFNALFAELDRVHEKLPGDNEEEMLWGQRTTTKEEMGKAQV